MKSKILVYTSGGSLRKTLLGDELFNGVTYYKSINASKDLQLGQVASAQVTFTTTYASIAKTDYFKYYTWQECDTDYRLIGYYYVDNISKDGNFYTVTGYDCVSKFDRDFTAELQTCTSTTLTQLYQYVCQKCGVGSGTSSFWTNTYMPVDPKSLITTGVTARAIMGYIAEATGSYVYTRDDNLVHCYTYSSPSPAVAITASDYSSLTMEDVPAPAITSVTVQLSSGSYSTSSNTSASMNFLYNPLFYNKTASAVSSYVNNIYNVVHSIGAYYPCKFKCFSDLKLKCGDKVTVNGKAVIIMSMRITDSGCEFECFGNPTREPLVMQNTDKITNLEANSNDDAYLTDDWLNDNNNKVFNSILVCNDLYCPSGLGYRNNTSNKSLISVIQALLVATGLQANTSYTVNMTYDSGPNHTITGILDSTYTAGTPTGSVSVTGSGPYTITCTGTTNGSATFTKNGVTITYTVNCYTNIYTVMQTYYRDYQTDINSSNARVKVVYNGNTYTDRYDVSSDGIDNSDLTIYYDVTAGYEIKLKKTGIYTVTLYEKDHPDDPAGTWKLLSQ